eukprot:NODE_1233_length_1624_cov_29.620317_g1098_i0.p1 GENE.NODE_1233_length_1624_cov_29.620317_g1098_i0~~NODE_1233_length_1624_cov_29.620317_g1098_i0.p1  ORF type:complete len:311 (+),score=30.67 NODE_1233_length_1624_cov_29.620317_g1098_i0:109-1041(+)
MLSTVVICGLATGSLGAAGAVLLLLCCIFYPGPMTMTRQLLVCLAIADFIVGLRNATYLVDHLDRGLCVFQTVFGIFGGVASFWWTAFLSAYIYIQLRYLTRGEIFSMPQRAFIVMVLIATLHPLLIVAVILSGTSDEIVEGSWYCYISPSNALWLWLMPVQYACLLFTVLMCLLSIAIVVPTIRALGPLSELGAGRELRRHCIQLAFIPLVFILQRAFGFGYHTLRSRGYGALLPELYVCINTVCIGSQGLLHLLIWTLGSPRIRSTLYRALRSKLHDSSANSKAIPMRDSNPERTGFLPPTPEHAICI